MTKNISQQSSHYFFFALYQAISVPALILALSTIGFGGFAKEMGFSLLETLFIVPVIWALPSQVTLMAGIHQQMDIAMIFLTVTFTAIRLMPMSASFLPILKADETPKWKLILFSHFVVITTWVEGRRFLVDIPREQRLFVMSVYAIALVVSSMGMSAFGYFIAETVPPKFASSLVYTIPLYFCLSMSYAALKNKEMIAFLIGLCSLPLTHALSPDFDLIISGLIGGTIGFLLLEMKAKNKKSAHS